MDALPQRLAQLSPEKRALLEQLRLQRQAAAAIVPRDPAVVVPLSLAQRRLWLVEQMRPGQATYIMPCVLMIKGLLDRNALAASLSWLLQRHEVLRTSIQHGSQGAYQQIHAPWQVELGLVEVDQTQLESQLRQYAQQAFDLKHAPLWRAQLWRCAPEQHVLGLMLHHIIADGWSLGVLMHDLALAYAHFATGAALNRVPLPIQYGDYACWQAQQPAMMLPNSRDFWLKLLHDAPTLALPTDYPRPAVQSFQGAQIAWRLPSELVEQLKQLSQRQSATLFMSLLTAFYWLLHWLSEQTDLVVGTDVAGRQQPETHQLIGFFINQLMLRQKVQPYQSFQASLQQTRQLTLAAFEHQHVPFDQIVELLNVAHDPSRTPLFQVKFVLQNTPLPTLQLAGVELERMDLDPHTAKFDLLINLWEEHTGLAGTLDYNTDIFAAQRMQQLLERYQLLLKLIVLEPTITLEAAVERCQSQERELQQQRLEQRKAANRSKLILNRRRSSTEPTQ
ncbi:condensation domain-containing protein [Herpetosiphon gulosus]|uniref:Linear gramicidin synthase subunit D n=1 Tax=Herpetosiphon gulosus TaxID=1973496 RepID=A0ABP9X6T3_9CHLR